LLLILTVFGGVLVAHLYSFWRGPCCSSLQFLVGSLLLIFTVFVEVLAAHLYSFWWGPCCSSLQFLLRSLLPIFTVFVEVLVAQLYSFLYYIVCLLRLFVIVLCFARPMLPVSLDYWFLVTPWVLSYVYWIYNNYLIYY
jgi:hypothetical protein